MAVTKADLAETLFNELGLNKREAKEFVELFFEKTRQSLEEGVAVKLSGFGNFDVRDKKSRPGRNPKTGEEIPITARRVVTFKASQKLKDRVAGLPTTTDTDSDTGKSGTRHDDVEELKTDAERDSGVPASSSKINRDQMSTVESHNLTGSTEIRSSNSGGDSSNQFSKIKTST